VKVRYAASTDVGRCRERNEDAVVVVPEHLLFVVADGMGGHTSGEVASRIAVETMAATFGKTGPGVGAPANESVPPLGDRLDEAVQAANRAVFSASRSAPHLRGMGTTVVAAAIDAAGICVAHAGDSRAYRVRAGAIERLTQDHSLVEMLRGARGAVGGDVPSNVILRALGVNETVEVDLRIDPIAPGDRFVLCSDGLHGMVEDGTILAVVLEEADPRGAAAKLVDRANEAGGADNVSAIVIHCDGP
jgi:PPM family protein phosphatase